MTGGATTKVIVHIGPPKTATTSLQYTLQKQELPDFVYCGVTQPRGPRVELAARLHGYCSAQEPIAIDDLRSEISGILSSGRQLVVSEEMFLVDQKVWHQEKLSRLASVLSGFPVLILVTARDPVSGLCSLYQQLFPLLPFLQRISFGAFLRGNQAKVYDYDHLARILREAGFSRVRYLAFDALVSGTVSYEQLLDRPDRSGKKVIIPRENVSRTASSGDRALSGISVGEVLRLDRGLPATAARWLRSRAWIHGAWSRLRSVLIIDHGSRRLLVPDAMASDLRRKFRRVTS